MDWLYSLLDNSSLPVATAFILGILTAVSPCPLATNLTAVAYLGREIDNRRKVFLLGSLYTLGRIVAYSMLGAVMIFLIRNGKDAFNIQDSISTIGEWILGPALIFIGLFMLLGHLLHLPKFGFSGQASGSWTNGAPGAFFPGRAFCHGILPHQWNALFRHAHSYVGSGVRRLFAHHGLCHSHSPSGTCSIMDYCFQYAVVRQADVQDSHLSALAQPSRSHPLHPFRLILYDYKDSIT